MPHHDSRRSFLKQLAGGLGALPIAGAAGALTAPPAFARQPDQFWDRVRAQFPFSESMVPMNAGNLCPSPRQVAERVSTLSQQIENDVSHGHRDGFHDLLEASRAKVADHLHADPDEIALVRNTTEANAAIIAGLPLGAGDEVVVWEENHPTNNVAWDVQAARAGLEVRRVQTPADLRSPPQLADRFIQAIGPRTRVLALTHVSNTSGLLLPVKAICEQARRRDVFVHLDGAQSWGALPIDLHDLGCDSFSASCHKWLCGPKEAGVLYVKREHVERVWAPTSNRCRLARASSRRSASVTMRGWPPSPTRSISIKAWARPGSRPGCTSWRRRSSRASARQGSPWPPPMTPASPRASFWSRCRRLGGGRS